MMMAPRGAGTMIASLVVGRLLRFIDPRVMIAIGMSITATTMWMMTQLTNDIQQETIIFINVIQGVSFACFIVPVNTVAFSTLPDAQRDVGTAFYSLLNNIGRGLGIAILAGVLARHTQTSYAILSEQITPFNAHLRHIGVPSVYDPSVPAGLRALNRLVASQAELMAYIADFQLMMFIIIGCLPVLLFMSAPRRPS